MHVAITGAGGFVGGKLAAAILRDGVVAGRPVDKLTLIDLTLPAVDPALVGEGISVEAFGADIANKAMVDDLMNNGVDILFHLAAIVSGHAEADFDLGYAVNLDGTRHLLEACRRTGNCPRVVFASSVAVFGGKLPDVLTDDTRPTPATSYGGQKLMAEVMVTDYTRKGFITGVSLRLPTVVVRPGAPNRAASSYASSLFREPLQGKTTVIPVDESAAMWLGSPRAVVASFLHAVGLDSDRLGHDRSITLPGLTANGTESVEALRRAGGQTAVDRLVWEKDDAIAHIVAGWPSRFEPERALALGFPQDKSLDAIVNAFVTDELDGQVAA